MAVRWTARAANDRSAQFAQESSPSAPAKKKAIRESGWLFSTMCSACAERDVPFGRDVCFASDVRFGA